MVALPPSVSQKRWEVEGGREESPDSISVPYTARQRSEYLSVVIDRGMGVSSWIKGQQKAESPPLLLE